MIGHCDLCGKNTIIAGTFHLYTQYRYEDRDYILIKEEDKTKGYFEIVRFCPSCLRKYCIGENQGTIS